MAAHLPPVALFGVVCEQEVHYTDMAPQRCDVDGSFEGGIAPPRVRPSVQEQLQTASGLSVILTGAELWQNLLKSGKQSKLHACSCRASAWTCAVGLVGTYSTQHEMQ